MNRPASTHPVCLQSGNVTVWMMVAASLAVVVCGYVAAGLSVDLWSGRHFLPLIPFCAALAWFYRKVRPDPWISTGAETVAQVMSILVLGTLLSYAAAAWAMPYRDSELERLDRALGFNWRSCLEFLNAHPLLGTASHLAYFSMKPQSVLVIGALVVGGHFDRLKVFALATAFTLMATIAIFAFMPAVGYYAHLGLTPSDIPDFSPSMTYSQMNQLEAIRHASMRVVRFDDLEGIIAFPSFHTAAALLATWALWPCRRLRLGIAVLNIAMVASAPFEGAHYFVDLPPGALVAALSILAALRLYARVTAAPGDGAASRDPSAAATPAATGQPVGQMIPQSQLLARR